METGIVKWFNDSKGFGFIKPDDGGLDIILFLAHIKDNGRKLRENDMVRYVKVASKHGPAAREVVWL